VITLFLGEGYSPDFEMLLSNLFLRVYTFNIFECILAPVVYGDLPSVALGGQYSPGFQWEVFLPIKQDAQANRIYHIRTSYLHIF
jgi:hypothetical protein